MHHGMIDFEENKLLNHAGKPKNGHTNHKKPAQGCSGKILAKDEANQSHKNKQINEPEISNLNDGFVGDIQFSQFIFPVK